MLLRKTQSWTLRGEVQTSGRMEIESTNVYALSGQMSVSSSRVFYIVRFETKGATVWHLPTSRFALSDTRAFPGLPIPMPTGYYDELRERRSESTGDCVCYWFGRRGLQQYEGFLQADEATPQSRTSRTMQTHYFYSLCQHSRRQITRETVFRP
jgi:hypothetical protein